MKRKRSRKRQRYANPIVATNPWMRNPMANVQQVLAMHVGLYDRHREFTWHPQMIQDFIAREHPEIQGGTLYINQGLWERQYEPAITFLMYTFQFADEASAKKSADEDLQHLRELASELACLLNQSSVLVVCQRRGKEPKYEFVECEGAAKSFTTNLRMPKRPGVARPFAVEVK